MLHDLDAALAARIALARSVSPALAQHESDAFAQMDAQVNQHIETAAYLITQASTIVC
jgi:hypothetical protein